MVVEGRDALLTDKEAAAELGVSVSLLRKWRSRRNEGPGFYRLGRLIRYSRPALRDFLESCRISRGSRPPTTDRNS
jgi:hypothetical protein